MPARIVTDSSADLPKEVADELGIVVVPLTVRFGDEEFVDGRDLTPKQFWAHCARSPVLPETSPPRAAVFEEAYRKLAAEGATEIVSIHISSALSRTLEAAEAAAPLAPVPVLTVDTESASLGQGIIAIEAARMARAGARGEEIEAAALARRDRLEVHACLDTLEYLRKGGRIGGARAFLGSMLDVKPLITIKGEVQAEGRVRTRARALSAIVDTVKSHFPVESMAVMHGAAADLDDFLEMLEPLTSGDVLVGQVGPVVGAHAGPGVIGVAYFRG